MAQTLSSQKEILQRGETVISISVCVGMLRYDRYYTIRIGGTKQHKEGTARRGLSGEF